MRFHIGEIPLPLNVQKSCPQVKICGLTLVDEAVTCIEAGADAVGCVFYPPSPRCVTEDQALEIVKALPAPAWVVGVFVNEDYSEIMGKAERCRLRAVQLHGREAPLLIDRLRRRGLKVIKALFHNGFPPLSAAASYDASAYLVECAGGPLPGGNAMIWDWSAANSLARTVPIVLAGGLNAENVSTAIEQAAPDAVDVSSGVESVPGRKDMGKVRDFLQVIRLHPVSRNIKRVFD